MYWYHPDRREYVNREMGLYGTIVVEPSDDLVAGDRRSGPPASSRALLAAVSPPPTPAPIAPARSAHWRLVPSRPCRGSEAGSGPSPDIATGIYLRYIQGMDTFTVLAEPTRRRILDELLARRAASASWSSRSRQPAHGVEAPEGAARRGFVSSRSAAQQRIYRIEARRRSRARRVARPVPAAVGRAPRRPRAPPRPPGVRMKR